MEPEKSKSPITNKTPIQKHGDGKSEEVDDKRAVLIKASKLPAYLQRRAIANDDDEKRKKELLNKQVADNKMVIIQKK